MFVCFLNKCGGRGLIYSIANFTTITTITITTKL